MPPVRIPCNHNLRNIVAQQKVLRVKFVGHNGCVNEVNPFCGYCTVNIVGIEHDDCRQCSAYCDELSRHLRQLVREKAIQLRSDEHNSHDDFVYNAADYRIVHECDWFLQCTHNNEFGEVVNNNNTVNQVIDESLAAVKATPATQEAIEGLERFTTKTLKEMTTCAICLDELKPKKHEVGARMPCEHEFHEECILEWLHNSHFCPLCRFELPTNTI